MATYNNLSYGSSGNEVKKLQQALINAGYNVGSAGADGIYGVNTQNAVKKYQSDNGLDVDGIAGNNTLGKLYGNNSGTGTAAPVTNNSAGAGAKPSTTAQAADSSKYTYDASGDAAYQQALQALQQAQQNKPTFADTYGASLKDMYEQIVNRDKFQYDLNGDMLYQQYKDQYVNLGQMAMRDTMGQAAALTGGYGSTYGQSVGQQQYDAYLQELNGVVPELYGMALNQYNAEGEQMMDQYAMLSDMNDEEYGRYMDDMNQYWNNVNYLQGQADDAYNRGYENWYNAYQMQLQADELAYQKEQDAYNREVYQDEKAYERKQAAYERLVSLITSTGYTPTTDEMIAAGMSAGELSAYKSYYEKQNAAATTKSSGGGSGGGSSGGGSYNNGGYSSAAVKQAQRFVGASADGMWGANSAAAAKAKGYNSLAEVIAAINSEYNGPTSVKANATYNTGELLDAAASGMGYDAIMKALEERGVDTSKATVQADVRWALSK